MSIETITGDQFAALGPAEHALAIYLYQEHINLLERQLKVPFSENQLLSMQDEMARTITMRKLHVVLLNELLAAPAETDGATVATAA